MAKGWYAILYIFVDVVILFTLYMDLKYKNRIGRSISFLMGISIISTNAYLLTIIFNSYEGIKLGLCIYCASMDWLCVAVLIFVVAFTRMDRVLKKIWFVILPIVILDTISQLANFWFEHATAYQITYVNNDMYLTFLPNVPFQVHLAICYILSIISYVILIYRTLKSPNLYKPQYITMLCVFGGIVLIDAAYLIFGWKLDIAVMGYSVGGAVIHYYTFKDLPKNLTGEMSNMVLNEISSAIMLFDMNGICVYENAYAKLGGNWVGKDLEEVSQIIQVDMGKLKQDFEEEIVVSDDGKALIFKTQFKRLIEQTTKTKRSYLGCYFVLDNITKEREQLLKREYQATHDDLTGLYNLSYFCEAAAKMIHENPEETFCILMTNVYQFKLFNEVFGNEAGDKVIQYIAELFPKKLNNPKIIYARFHADQFIVCLPKKFCTEENFKKYEVTEPINLDDFKIINYLGIYEITDPNEPIKAMCERAAIALNSAKGNETKRYAFYDHTIKDKLLKENELVASFPTALENGEFVLYIQPQIHSQTGDIVGGEVLIRWILPDGKVVSPGEFIPVLEKRGMISKLDYYVWEEACKLICKLRDMNLVTSLSVNISAQDFYFYDLYQVFTELTEKYDILPQYLKLEITESEIMQDVDKQIILIKRLQEYGFIVEMDDFGSGYSSLNTLKDIPVDILKMDMYFLHGNGNSSRGKQIIEVVTFLAKTLQIPVIAEGVEDAEQVAFLHEIGCDYIQGYYYGKPMPFEQFLEMRKEKEFCDMIQR